MHGHRAGRIELDDLGLELDPLAEVLEDVPKATAHLGRPVGERLALGQGAHPGAAPLRRGEPGEDLLGLGRDLDRVLVSVHARERGGLALLGLLARAAHLLGRRTAFLVDAPAHGLELVGRGRLVRGRLLPLLRLRRLGLGLGFGLLRARARSRLVGLGDSASSAGCGGGSFWAGSSTRVSAPMPAASKSFSSAAATRASASFCRSSSARLSGGPGGASGARRQRERRAPTAAPATATSASFAFLLTLATLSRQRGVGQPCDRRYTRRASCFAGPR